jgi:hypothetical protein
MGNGNGLQRHNALPHTVRSPADLPAAWRERATELRRFGAEPQAVTLEAVAAELEAALRAADDEELTLKEAAAESGYSAERLRHKVAEGDVPNAGRKGAPRIRRADLPRKASKTPATPGTVAGRIAADWGRS